MDLEETANSLPSDGKPMQNGADDSCVIIDINSTIISINDSIIAPDELEVPKEQETATDLSIKEPRLDGNAEGCVTVDEICYGSQEAVKDSEEQVSYKVAAKSLEFI